MQHIMHLRFYAWILGSLLMASLSSNGQPHPLHPELKRCISEELFDQQMRQAQVRQQVQDLEHAYRQALQRGMAARSLEPGCKVAIIPVVVHVIYNDEVSNVSDAQILSQMEVLNEDYRRGFETRGYGSGVDMKIQFALARRAPDGSPTNGITRTESSLTNHNKADEVALKSLISWDTERYLNIWVVKEISFGSGNTLGYTYLPGTVPRWREGVVLTGKYFGRAGTATPPYNLGRTLTHEIGHYLGLHHTFRSEGVCSDTSAADCLLTGDRVCDTPAELEAKYFCPEETNSCVERPCDLPDPIRNYLNYVDDACMDEFTEGQRQRVFQFLTTHRATLISAENLAFTGCDGTPVIRSVPEARFTASATSTCAGDIIQFVDASIGCVESWQWEFEGGIPAVSTEPAPTVRYPEPGAYDVRLRVVNAAAADTLIRKELIVIPELQSRTSFRLTFEQGTLLPEGWQADDEDGRGGWLLTTLARRQGFGAALARNFDLNGRCTSESLVSPVFHLPAGEASRLSFDYAYRQRRDEYTFEDRLLVELSEDCGTTFPYRLFEAGGDELATVEGELPDEPFIPKDGRQWREVSIDLADFQARDHLRIRFRNEGRGGQHVFLDNLVLSQTVSRDEQSLAQLRLWPNPFQHRLHLSFTLKRAQTLELRWQDALGQVIWADQWLLAAGEHVRPLPPALLQRLPAGVYFLELASPETRLRQKLIKHP